MGLSTPTMAKTMISSYMFDDFPSKVSLYDIDHGIMKLHRIPNLWNVDSNLCNARAPGSSLFAVMQCSPRHISTQIEWPMNKVDQSIAPSLDT
eukprot:6200535-Pleurochrysis_carterae.AAC.4